MRQFLCEKYFLLSDKLFAGTCRENCVPYPRAFQSKLTANLDAANCQIAAERSRRRRCRHRKLEFSRMCRYFETGIGMHLQFIQEPTFR